LKEVKAILKMKVQLADLKAKVKEVEERASLVNLISIYLSQDIDS
jgi:hypothetical protein